MDQLLNSFILGGVRWSMVEMRRVSDTTVILGVIATLLSICSMAWMAAEAKATIVNKLDATITQQKVVLTSFEKQTRAISELTEESKQVRSAIDRMEGSMARILYVDTEHVIMSDAEGTRFKIQIERLPKYLSAKKDEFTQ